MHLLIVDDDAVFRAELADLLKDEGHEVTVAPNVPKAMETLESIAVDGILTDLKMPRQTGLDLLKQVKARFPRIRVVMVTGYATVDSAVQAMKYGAFDYLSKPFTTDQVRSVLKTLQEDLAYSGDAGPVVRPIDLAHKLGAGGDTEVLVVALEPPAAAPHIVPLRLDPTDLAKIRDATEALLGKHEKVAVVIANVEVIARGRRIEDVTGFLMTLRSRLDGHGVLALGFDPREVSGETALALQATVAAPTAHATLDCLTSPIRRAAVRRLADGPASFSEVMRASGLDDTPKMSFHLRRLAEDGLISHKDEVYGLTARGLGAASLLADIDALSTRSGDSHMIFAMGTPVATTPSSGPSSTPSRGGGGRANA